MLIIGFLSLLKADGKELRDYKMLLQSLVKDLLF